MPTDWMTEGAKLLGVATPIAIVAGAVAWFVAKTAATHTSQQFLQTHKSVLDESLETHKASLNLAIEAAKAKIGRETDESRLLLKRQEMMFEREIEAADAFNALFRELYPKATYLAEWDDACLQMAENVSAFEKGLEKFLSTHSMAISREVSGQLEHAKTIAAETGYEVGMEVDPDTGSYRQGQYPSETVNKSVTEMFETLQKASERIRDDLLTGSLARSAAGPAT